MSVYVDECIFWGRGKYWCHMGADTLKELHLFAKKIGLKKEWFQNKSLPHYDLVKSKRELAIKKGAIELDMRAYNKKMRSTYAPETLKHRMKKGE